MDISRAADSRLTIFDTQVARDEKSSSIAFFAYENLLVELDKVFSQLKHSFDGTLGVTAKSEYRTDRRPYQQVFNDDQRRIVERAFAKEIERHGYSF